MPDPAVGGQDPAVGSVISGGGVLDDEASLEAGDGFGEACGFDAVEDVAEVFVGIRGFIERVLAAVAEDIGGMELGVDVFLVEGSFGVAASHASACAVVDGPGGLFGTAACDHDDGAVARVAGEEDGVAGIGEGGMGEGEVACGDGAGGAFAVDPGLLALDEFLAGDVVGDEVDELALAAWEDFLEGFEDEGIDDEVVDGCEVGTEGHVIEVGVGLRGSEGGVDELSVSGGKGGVPAAELGFEVAELGLGEDVTEAAGSAVAEEGDMAIAKAEAIGGAADGGTVGETGDFAFSEVISAAVGAELLDFLGEVLDASFGEDAVEADFEGIGGAVVAGVTGVFAAFDPVLGDAEGVADFRCGTFGDDACAEVAIDGA